jgi:hypothetical protein
MRAIMSSSHDLLEYRRRAREDCSAFFISPLARLLRPTECGKSALKNTVQRLGESGDRAFDVMQFVQAK